ncbi:MAG: type ISP restriction/modification enzyme [Verrucomicrobiales bacterium]
MDVRPDYQDWHLLPSLFPVSYPGVKTSRDAELVDIDREALESRIARYFDSGIKMSQLKSALPGLAQDASRFSADQVRAELLALGINSGKFIRYCYRPLDFRWVYWHPQTKLLDEKRSDYVAQCDGKNYWLFTTGRTRKDLIEPPIPVREVTDLNLMDSGARGFPIYVLPDGLAENIQAHPDLFAPAKPSGPQANLTDFALEYLAGLKCGAEDLFFHIVAVLHAPLYREENAGALRQDWPRVPLPKTAKVLQAGAALGRQIAALLDPETPVEGVTTLQVRPDLKGLGELTVKPGGKAPDLAIAARWGYAGQGGVTMPGPGLVTTGTRGEGYLDIHLNATTRWKDVPEAVWRYTLGGYQVLKKWLSYRESALLGRPLTSDEAQQFTHHVRRIASILALHGKLDAHYGASV